MTKTLIAIAMLTLNTFRLLGTTQEEKVLAVYESIPQSCESIELYTQKALERLEKSLQDFLLGQVQDFQHVILDWHEIMAQAFAQMQVLTATASPEHQACALVHSQKIQNAIQQAMQNPVVLQTILHFAENHTSKDSLTPSQRTYVYNVLKSVNTKLLSEDLKTKFETLQKDFSLRPRGDYTFLKGKNFLKKDKKSFTILNLNTCFLWDMLPMLWGGVLPWEFRMQGIVHTIKKQDADLLCLQEVFDWKVSRALYEQLKDTYKYFYIDIGPRNFGLSLESFGLSSGLFVASRYEIHKPQFIAFGKNSPSNRSYGFFFGNLLHQNKIIVRFITTHLQPFHSVEGKTWRNKQMKQILTFMRSQEPMQAPFILCGDLNMQWQSKEPAQILMNENFYTAYRPDKTTLTTRTCLDYTDYWWKDHRDIRKFRGKPEILDYCLLLQKKHKKGIESKYPMKTKVISMSKPSEPDQALSDHQGIMTWIQLPPEKKRELQ